MKMLLQRKINKRFAVERKLLGNDIQPLSDHKSIIHFSMNKAATQYVKSILNFCANKNKLINVDFSSYAFQTDFPYLDQLSKEEMRDYGHIFRNKGFLYSVFGGFVEGIPDLEKYMMLLVIRDPRDILVSRYYSISYNHPLPAPVSGKFIEFITKRNKARNMDIDSFAIEKSDLVLDIFERYRVLLLKNHSNVYLTRYEDMLDDFHSWLISILDYCELKLDKKDVEILIRENKEIKPVKEDKQNRYRRGVAGDFREKLSSKTIDYLNIKFENVIKTFDYSF